MMDALTTGVADRLLSTRVKSGLKVAQDTGYFVAQFTLDQPRGYFRDAAQQISQHRHR